jgi:ubiquinone/menaquinone biosynthesis C-methylase UbiE
VDAAFVDKLAKCLRYMDTLPGFQEYKSAMLGFMNPQRGSLTADLGCGLGFDLRRLSTLVGPEGRAIGVDSSHALITSARAASVGFPDVEFVQADIQHLPFAPGLLQSCKVDRTLQHVEQPGAVLSEIFRTLQADGTVVCAEPDWAAFQIDDQSEIARQVAETWMKGIRNPRIGHDLEQLLKQTGFIDLQVEEVVLSTGSFASSEIVFDIAQTAARLAETRGSEAPLTWLADLLTRDAENPVCCSVTLMVYCAKRPRCY